MLCVNPGAAVHYGWEHISPTGWNTGIPITLSPPKQNDLELEVWANAQRDGRPAEYRWRPLFNTAKFG